MTVTLTILLLTVIEMQAVGEDVIIFSRDDDRLTILLLTVMQVKMPIKDSSIFKR